MIVEVPHLQAFKCDACERIYELGRNHGHEDDLNRKLDFKKRLQLRHQECVSKEAVVQMPVQGSVH